MIQLQPGERCTCSRSTRTGRLYFGREVCRGCDWFIVSSQAEIDTLKRLEAKQAERERRVPDLDTALALVGLPSSPPPLNGSHR